MKALDLVKANIETRTPMTLKEHVYNLLTMLLIGASWVLIFSIITLNKLSFFNALMSMIAIVASYAARDRFVLLYFERINNTYEWRK